MRGQPRASYNGITSASQADDEGSTPFARSTALPASPFPVSLASRIARRRALAFVFPLALLGLALTLATPAGRAAGPEQLFSALRTSVVTVHTLEYVPDNDQPGTVTVVPGEGSGVLFSADGKVLTVAHLVQTADAIAVEFDDGTRVRARVYAAEPAADVALLQLDGVPEGKEPAALGDSAAVRTGQQVVVLGAPFGIAGALSVGYVSGRQRPTTPFGHFAPLEMFVIDAHVERGSSGGGVFDAEGRLIGLVTSVQYRAGNSHGLGFAVTAATVRAMLVERRSFWTGIGGYWVSGPLAQALNVPQPAGLLVQRFAQGSPAAQLKLRAGTMAASAGGDRFVLGGDIVLSAQGIALDGPDAYARMQDALAGLRNGEPLRMTVLRAGRLLELSAPIAR